MLSINYTIELQIFKVRRKKGSLQGKTESMIEGAEIKVEALCGIKSIL